MQNKNKTAPEAGTSKSGSKNISIDEYIQNILGCQDSLELQAIEYVMAAQLALSARWINVDFWDYPHSKTVTCQVVGKDVYRSVDIVKTGNDWLDRYSALKKALGGIEL